VSPARKAHGKDQNQIEHFAVRDRKTHGKMLSVRPRRQIGRARGTMPPCCRGYLFAVRFDSRVSCVVFLPCVSLKYAVCSCFAVCLIYICRELLICHGLGVPGRPTAPEWRTATPDFPVVYEYWLLIFITCVCSGIRSSTMIIRVPSTNPSRRGLRHGELLVRSLQACSR
jgi:hypothetical protein